MPVYLPPISRRRFLKGALAAAGSLAIRPDLLGESATPDQSSWALLSDPHLAADAGLVSRKVNMTQHFQQVSRELLALSTPLTGVMITGDCAYNTGEVPDYEHLVGLLDPLRKAGLPIHLALGNHDHREHFWEVFKNEKAATRPVIDRQMCLLRAPEANWYVLDSLEVTRSSPGLLGPEQLHWLAKALDENPKTPALIVIHHNPGLNGGNLGLKDTLPLFEVIRPRIQVKAYIYGHTHAWNVEADTSGIHLINLPPVSYVFREREPSGWVHATIQATGMQLELRCVDPTHEDHGQKMKLAWRT
jgi:3',5'-cyclic AMP phosphodiesterase CpdA